MDNPTPIDYDLIRERAHHLRREFIADLFRRAEVKLRTLMSARAHRAASHSTCSA